MFPSMGFGGDKGEEGTVEAEAGDEPQGATSAWGG